jgi:hypothetical protein
MHQARLDTRNGAARQACPAEPAVARGAPPRAATMQHHLRALAMVLALLAVAMPAASRAQPATSTSIIEGLSEAVAAAAAATRPRHWPLRHACLYYALAGQALLARQGIAATLRVGRVVYRPGTPGAHPIAPHVWLDTGTHLVDYAMLPRRGEVAIVPKWRIATHPSQVVPGVTPVLVLAAHDDQALGLFLRHHHRRFHGRCSRTWAGAPARSPAARRACGTLSGD